MRPDCEEIRIEAFRFMIDRTVHIPKGDIGIMGALGIVVATYLLGLEKQLYEQAKAISQGDGINMYRRTPFKPIKNNKRKRRRKTVATILAIRFYFQWDCQSEEMTGLLNLLMSLAVDDSEGLLSGMAQSLVVGATLRDPDLWQLLEEEFDGLCRLIELEAS